EVHAALNDDLLAHLRRLDGQLQAVAYDIGHAMIDLWRLVIVGEDDRVFLALEPVDLENQRRIEGPLDFGNFVANTVEHLLGGPLDRFAEGEVEMLGQY